jgi:hypothetical protein
MFHGNQILNNQTAVHVRSEAMPTFHTNKISGSAEEGVKIEGEAKGRYVENEVSGVSFMTSNNPCFFPLAAFSLVMMWCVLVSYASALLPICVHVNYRMSLAFL